MGGRTPSLQLLSYISQFGNMESQKYNLFLPVSILIAAVLIAGALVYNAGIKSVGNNTPPEEQVTGDPGAARDVSAEDHIRGSINAPVKLITYEDTECPFCKRFHTTLQQVMKDYDGKVAWVYRHFPLDAIHSKARNEALAVECAGELGGDEKFWMYLDRIFEVTPSNDGLDPAELPKIAVHVGLDRAKFEACLTSGRHAERVSGDLENAIAAGGSGTPFTIIVDAKGEKKPVSGALPYEQMKLIIDEALR